MSVVSSRPRVRGVSLTGAATAAVAGASLAAVIVRSLGRAAKTAYTEAAQAREALESSGSMQSVAEIERRQERVSNLRSSVLKGLSQSDALKVETALRLQDYAASDVRTLAPRVLELARCRSMQEAQKSSESLLETARMEHHRLLVTNLTRASVRASKKTGFETVETRRRGDQVRVIATNPAGQALVTEISASITQDPSMATEAVGIRDGSCHEILDRFDEALEAQGVIAGPPRRSPTGGVCQLDTARGTIRKLYSAARKSPRTKSVNTAKNDQADETESKRSRTRKQIRQRRRS